MTWQLIETAPHETTVLLYSPPVDGLYDGKIEVGFASSGHRWPHPSGGISSNMSWHGSATHWMPLPPRPDDRTNGSEAQSGSLNQTLPASSVSGTDAVEVGRAISDIAAERRRQIEAEGWSHEHDDQHDKGEIARAAASYAWVSTKDGKARELGAMVRPDTKYPEWTNFVSLRRLWPWSWAWWKPKTPRSDLVRAGALIVAEIERLDRAAIRSRTDGGTNG